MSGEDPPMPADEQDVEDEPEEPGLYPFVDAAAGGGPGVTVRAGWANEETGDPEELVVNYSGSAGSPAAVSAFETAVEWYRDVVGALINSQEEQG